MNPCDVNKDSSACTWSEYGEDWLDPPPADGSDVLRVWSYVQAGPQNSIAVELRHMPDFGTFMTVHRVIDRRDRIYLRVPDAVWDKAQASLTTFRAFTTKLGFKEYEQPGCIDGNWLEVDTLTGGKSDHLHGYECESGPAITFTIQLRKLVIASIPYCAGAGTEDVSDCLLLDGDKFLAGQVLKPLTAFKLTCDDKSETLFRSVLAKDVRLNQVGRPAISSADAVTKTLHDLACPLSGRSPWIVGVWLRTRGIEGRSGAVFVSGDFNISKAVTPPDPKFQHLTDQFNAPATLTWERNASGSFEVRDIQIGKLLIDLR